MSHRYDQVWDWKKAEASGKLEFCTRVTPNKKAEAYEKLQQRGYFLPGFYKEVCDIPSSDGTDWTEEDKRRFRASIFKEQKSIIKVSKTIGKPMKQCMTYYYGTFKKSKDYPRLKLSIYRQNDQAVKTRRSNWICDTCGTGGRLIACDSCELHFHLDCLEPPLKEVPEGTWICNTCTTKTTEEPCDKKANLAATSCLEHHSTNKLDTNLTMSSIGEHSPHSIVNDREKDETVNSTQDITASIDENNVKVRVVFRDGVTAPDNNDNAEIKMVDSDMYECDGDEE